MFKSVYGWWQNGGSMAANGRFLPNSLEMRRFFCIFVARNQTFKHETDIRTKRQEKCVETLDKDIGEVFGAYQD